MRLRVLVSQVSEDLSHRLRGSLWSLQNAQLQLQVVVLVDQGVQRLRRLLGQAVC